MYLKVAKIVDVANGLQAKQFGVGERYKVESTGECHILLECQVDRIATFGRP